MTSNPYFKVTPLFDHKYLRNCSYNWILIGTYTRPTQGCHFEWPWVILSDLAKYSMTWTIALSLCDSWVSCELGVNRLTQFSIALLVVCKKNYAYCGVNDRCTKRRGQRSQKSTNQDPEQVEERRAAAAAALARIVIVVVVVVVAVAPIKYRLPWWYLSHRRFAELCSIFYAQLLCSATRPEVVPPSSLIDWKHIHYIGGATANLPVVDTLHAEIQETATIRRQDACARLCSTSGRECVPCKRRRWTDQDQDAVSQRRTAVRQGGEKSSAYGNLKECIM